MLAQQRWHPDQPTEAGGSVALWPQIEGNLSTSQRPTSVSPSATWETTSTTKVPESSGYGNRPGSTSTRLPPLAGTHFFPPSAAETGPDPRSTESSDEMPIIRQPVQRTVDDREAHIEMAISSARLLEHQQRYDEAIAAYQDALRLDETDRSTLIHLARLQHRMGDLDGSVRTYQRALQAHGVNATILNDLGLCLARRNNYESSAAVLTAAVQLRPDNGRYVNNLAQVLVAIGEEEAAFSHLDRLLGAAHANFNLAVLLQKSGNLSGAARRLEMATKLEPEMVRAKEMLASLRVAEPKLASLPGRTGQATSGKKAPTASGQPIAR